MTPRVTVWLEQYAMSGGHLSWGEQRAATPMLLDAFLTIREAAALAAEHQEEEARRKQDSLIDGLKR